MVYWSAHWDCPLCGEVLGVLATYSGDPKRIAEGLKGEDWERLKKNGREPTKFQVPRIRHWPEGTIGANVGGTYIPLEEKKNED